MPDIYGFDHLTDWGVITVACIEEGCDCRGSLAALPEHKRRRHHQSHETQRARDAAARRRRAAAHARRMAALAARENAIVQARS